MHRNTSHHEQHIVKPPIVHILCLTLGLIKDFWWGVGWLEKCVLVHYCFALCGFTYRLDVEIVMYDFQKIVSCLLCCLAGPGSGPGCAYILALAVVPSAPACLPGALFEDCSCFVDDLERWAAQEWSTAL